MAVLTAETPNRLIQVCTVFYAQGRVELLRDSCTLGFILNPKGYFPVNFTRPPFNRDPLTIVAQGSLVPFDSLLRRSSRTASTRMLLVQQPERVGILTRSHFLPLALMPFI